MGILGRQGTNDPRSRRAAAFVSKFDAPGSHGFSTFDINDPDTVWSIINDYVRLIPPNRASDRPHPYFTRWHREHKFKE